MDFTELKKLPMCGSSPQYTWSLLFFLKQKKKPHRHHFLYSMTIRHKDS